MVTAVESGLVTEPAQPDLLVDARSLPGLRHDTAAQHLDLDVQYLAAVRVHGSVQAAQVSLYPLGYLTCGVRGRSQGALVDRVVLGLAPEPVLDIPLEPVERRRIEVTRPVPPVDARQGLLNGGVVRRGGPLREDVLSFGLVAPLAHGDDVLTAVRSAYRARHDVIEF